MLATQTRYRIYCSLLLLAVAGASLPLTQSANAEAQESASAKSAAPGDALIGEWWTEKNEGRIAMARYKDGTYRGTTTCCVHKNDPNNPETDINNPNPSLRGRPMNGVVLIWGLKFEDGEFVDGHVYNPRDGKTYRMKMTLVDHETLKIRGYMGIEMLGQTQIWKRYHPATNKAAN